MRPRLIHPFPPVFDASCRILVLGTFPSVASRADGFYYGHPRNRFWPLLAALFHAPVPATVAEKTALLLQNGVALWDVLQSCEIAGSADSAIRDPVANDLSTLLSQAPIRRVYANGQTAARLYRRYAREAVGLPVVALPSTSPANAAWSLEGLKEAWAELAG